MSNKTLAVPRYSCRLFGPDRLQPVFNDTDTEVLSRIYPADPTQLPKELSGVDWPLPNALPAKVVSR